MERERGGRRRDGMGREWDRGREREEGEMRTAREREGGKNTRVTWSATCAESYLTL